jgi:hypothetical protein
MRFTRTATLSTLVGTLLFLSAGAARAQTVVQIPLPGVLDTRGVLTLTNGTIVPFTLTIDGGGGDVGTGGLQNGFATKAVAMMKSPGNVANSLPDDGHFPEDMNHPEVVLNYSNAADPASPQNHLIKPKVGATPPDVLTFPVPTGTYSKFFLFFHGADGGTTVTITLTYADATTSTTMATIPDFFAAPTDPKVFVLANDLAKWGKAATITEAGGHRIFGVSLVPMAKTLMSVKVERGNTGYLVFWGATGVATGPVTGLPDAGTPPADAGAAGAGGAAGSSGAAGMGGAGGAAGAGSAGTGGAAGSDTTTGTAGSSQGGSTGVTGAAGSTAGAGGGVAGTNGTGGATGAGTAGASGTHGKGGSSGCSLSANDATRAHASWLLLAAAIVARGWRRRRRAP